jgi:drug/metabolite transporter (DMT)-like permease
VASQNIGRVAAWMSGAVISFSISAVAIRELGRQLTTFEILTIRSGLGIVTLLVLLGALPHLRHELALRHMGLHIARNSVHFVSQYSWALAVTILPFATVFALEFTMPAWVAILAALFLRERLSISRLGSIVLGFIGVLVIVRPGSESFQPAVLLVLFAALGFAVSLILTKQLTDRIGTFAIIFWMNAMQLPMTLAWPAYSAATGGPPFFVFRMGSDLLLPALALGVVGLVSHYCLTQAFRSGDATVVVPLDFLRIPLIALVGWAFYGEALDIFVFVGAALIICGVLWNLLAERQRPSPLKAREGV